MKKVIFEFGTNEGEHIPCMGNSMCEGSEAWQGLHVSWILGGVLTGGEFEVSRGILGRRRFWKGRQGLTVTEHVFHFEGVWFSCRSEATEGCRMAVLSEWRTSRVELYGRQSMVHPSQDWGA